MSRPVRVASVCLLVLALASLGAAADPTPAPETKVTVQIPEKPSDFTTPVPRPSTGTSPGRPTPAPTASPSASPTAPGDGTAPAGPEAPTAGAHALDLDIGTIPVGGAVVAAVHGFTPGEKVRFVIYSKGTLLGDSAADASGTAVLTFAISQRFPTGVHTSEAIGWQSHRVANQTIVVTNGLPAGSSLFPWIIWVIAGGVLLLALIAGWIAAARRSLPVFLNSPSAPIEGPGL